MGGQHGNDVLEDLHAYARDLRDAAPDLPPDGVRPVGVRSTRGATYASRTPHLVAAVAVAFLLVAGGAGTGLLADGAVPGDALYSLDLLIEDTWASIGIPLDTAAERRAEARVVAQRGSTLVALPAATPDRPDTENVGADAAEELTELRVALEPTEDEPLVADNGTAASVPRSEVRPELEIVAETTTVVALQESPVFLVPQGHPTAEARAMALLVGPILLDTILPNPDVGLSRPAADPTTISSTPPSISGDTSDAGDNSDTAETNGQDEGQGEAQPPADSATSPPHISPPHPNIGEDTRDAGESNTGETDASEDNAGHGETQSPAEPTISAPHPNISEDTRDDTESDTTESNTTESKGQGEAAAAGQKGEAAAADRKGEATAAGQREPAAVAGEGGGTE